MFRLYNPNPNGNLVGDCVIRAISCLTDSSWEETYLNLVVKENNMVNLDLIEETLDELISDGHTDFKTCEYIAHLTITKEVLLGKIGKPVELEKLISDFGIYSTSSSTDSFMDLCEDIKNFVRFLYRNSESTNDKNILRNTLNQIEKEVLNDGNNL